METPRIYYNTITITEADVRFVVGLIQEVYVTHAHMPARTRHLLAYQPMLLGNTPAMPVRHERLRVMTIVDWQQSNRKTIPPELNLYFDDHPEAVVVTYFQTYIPQQRQHPMWHVLPGGSWPLRIQKAQQQLSTDLAAFKLQAPPTLPQAPMPLKDLGYFSA